MKRKKAFTLIEVILAVLIMAATMGGIFALMSYSNAASRQQKAEGVAANLAKEELNKWLYAFKKENFDSISDDTDENWTLGNPYVVEGNQFYGTIRIKRHSDTVSTFVFPKVKWHDFQKFCNHGAEGKISGSSDFEIVKKSIKDVTMDPNPPSPPKNFRFVDISLRVKWKLPNENDFKPSNQFLLVTRRAFF